MTDGIDAGTAAPAAPAAAQPGQAAAAGVAQAVETQAEGKAQAAWTSLLPQDLRDNEVLRGFNKPGDFVREALAWKDRQATPEEGWLRVPGEKATDEERAAFWKGLGVPEAPEGYELPAGKDRSEALDAWLRSTAHGARLSQSQASALAKAMTEASAITRGSAQEEAAKAEKANAEAIARKYGDRLQESAELAKRGLSKSGVSRELYAKLSKAGVTSDPDFFDFAVGLGKTYEEDGFIRSGAMPDRQPTIADVFSYPSMRQ